MREIKFRAWDNFNERIWKSVDSLGLFFTNMEELAKAGNGIVYMQFTGLHDKNGKEIYEGDGYQVAKHKTYQVVYTSGIEFNFEWFGGCFCLKSVQDEKMIFPFDEFAMKHGEVVGNIFENPEILKQ